MWNLAPAETPCFAVEGQVVAQEEMFANASEGECGPVALQPERERPLNMERWPWVRAVTTRIHLPNGEGEGRTL